jgi:hypothetical protein
VGRENGPMEARVVEAVRNGVPRHVNMHVRLGNLGFLPIPIPVQYDTTPTVLSTYRRSRNTSSIHVMSVVTIHRPQSQASR